MKISSTSSLLGGLSLLLSMFAGAFASAYIGVWVIDKIALPDTVTKWVGNFTSLPGMAIGVYASELLFRCNPPKRAIVFYDLLLLICLIALVLRSSFFT